MKTQYQDDCERGDCNKCESCKEDQRASEGAGYDDYEMYGENLDE